MKIAAAIFSIILRSSHATIYEAQYGGCLNATLHNIGGNVGRGTSFHCHFTSDDCLAGEDWLTPTDVTLQGFTCTCDDDLNQNVFTTGCYDMSGSHQVLCASSKADCPEGWYVLGNRFNSGDVVEEDCAHGVDAFDTEEGSCGKQCLCNYEYKSRTDAIEIGSSVYGKCYNPDTNVQYCAATEGTCRDGETYHGPHGDTISGPECNCDRAKTGACMSDPDPTFYCAVAEDSCVNGMKFVKAADLPSNIDCRLCKNTWDEATVSPPPTPEVTQSPTPLVCIDDHVFRHKDKKKKSCSWIEKKAKRVKGLCKKKKVFAACKIACGKCCADDLTRTFKIGDVEHDCEWLAGGNRRSDQCTRSGVSGMCAATCGRCCSNDGDFEFDVGTADEPKLRSCGFFKKKKRAAKWCAKEPTIAAACQKSCDSCTDYTTPLKDGETLFPTTSPTASPISLKSEQGKDDD